MLSAASSALSACNEPVWALIVTTAGACLTSWSEFSDVGSKTERYTQAIAELMNLLSYWKSLPEVDRAAVDKIKHLVQRGESILSDERVAWGSTANKHVVRADLVADGNGSSDEAHAHRQRRSNRAL